MTWPAPPATNGNGHYPGDHVLGDLQHMPGDAYEAPAEVLRLNSLNQWVARSPYRGKPLSEQEREHVYGLWKAEVCKDPDLVQLFGFDNGAFPGSTKEEDEENERRLGREAYEAEEGGKAAGKAPASKSPFAPPVPASKLAAGEKPVDPVLEAYLFRKCTTLFTSLWKSGKTTWIAILLKEMGIGGNLAGLSVAKGRALVISEESQGIWRMRADKLGIGDHVDFYCRPFLGRPTLSDWENYCQHIADLTAKVGYLAVVIDTWAKVSPCDDENDASKTQAALNPLHRICEAGAGVLLSHHPKKGDAGDGQAARGSGALSGFVDVILEMRRSASGNQRERVLSAYSRFEGTPDNLVIALAEDGISYQSLGSRGEAERRLRLDAVRSLLPGEPPGLSAKELLKEWPEDIKKPSQRSLELDLKAGGESGQWSMAGGGKRSDPFTYWLNSRSDSRKPPLIGVGPLLRETQQGFDFAQRGSNP